MKSIYEFHDYRDYLRNLIDASERKGWGQKTKISSAIGCRPAYFSRVMAGTANLSLEQSESLAHFLCLTDDESDFFILLVEYARAGTPLLQKRLKKRIEKNLEERMVIKNRVKVRQKMSAEDQAIYYSSWFYAAIHILISIPQFQTPKAIAKALHLPMQHVSQTLAFLVEKGLAVEKNSKYIVGDSRLHLGINSPFLNRHLLNWRIEAINSLSRMAARDLHYSGVISISATDALKIREILVKTIEKTNSIIEPSVEEDIFCLSLDFFSLI